MASKCGSRAGSILAATLSTPVVVPCTHTEGGGRTPPSSKDLPCTHTEGGGRTPPSSKDLPCTHTEGGGRTPRVQQGLRAAQHVEALPGGTEQLVEGGGLEHLGYEVALKLGHLRHMMGHMGTTGTWGTWEGSWRMGQVQGGRQVGVSIGRDAPLGLQG